MKTILIALAAGVGCVLGVFVFLVIDFTFHSPFTIDENLWTTYGSMILGGIGAICGVGMGWVAHEWFFRPRICVPVSSEIPDGEVSVPLRKHLRGFIGLNHKISQTILKVIDVGRDCPHRQNVAHDCLTMAKKDKMSETVLYHKFYFTRFSVTRAQLRSPALEMNFVGRSVPSRLIHIVISFFLNS